MLQKKSMRGDQKRIVRHPTSPRDQTPYVVNGKLYRTDPGEEEIDEGPSVEVVYKLHDGSHNGSHNDSGKKDKSPKESGRFGDLRRLRDRLRRSKNSKESKKSASKSTSEHNNQPSESKITTFRKVERTSDRRSGRSGRSERSHYRKSHYSSRRSHNSSKSSNSRRSHRQSSQYSSRSGRSGRSGRSQSSGNSSWVSSSELTEVENDHQAFGNDGNWLEMIRSIQSKYPQFSILTEDEKRLFRVRLIAEYENLHATFPEIAKRIDPEELSKMSLQELYARQSMCVDSIKKHLKMMSYESNINLGLVVLKAVASNYGWNIDSIVRAISSNSSQYKLPLLELASMEESQQPMNPLAAIGLTLSIDLIRSTLATSARKYFGLPEESEQQLFSMMNKFMPQFSQEQTPPQESKEGIEIPTLNKESNPFADMLGGNLDISSLMKKFGPMLASMMGGGSNDISDDGDLDV